MIRNVISILCGPGFFTFGVKFLKSLSHLPFGFLPFKEAAPAEPSCLCAAVVACYSCTMLRRWISPHWQWRTVTSCYRLRMCEQFNQRSMLIIFIFCIFRQCLFPLPWSNSCCKMGNFSLLILHFWKPEQISNPVFKMNNKSDLIL